MSRRQPDLTINGLRLPLRIGAQIQQSYEDIGGFTLLRLGAGAAVPQQTWRKLRTTLSAQGIAPPGLAAIDWTQPVTLGCIAARSIQSASNVINIPAARRADAPPYGWAVMPGAPFRLQADPAIRVTISSLKPAESPALAAAIARALEPSPRTRSA